MSAALGLYRLQQVDSQMDQIHARLKAIQETLQNDLELRAATERFAAAESKNKDAARALKQSEDEFEKQRVKIEQTEASLYGGQVHNPKELQDLQKDVISLKKHLQTLEGRELEAMLVAETVEKEFQTAKTDLENVKSSKSRQNVDLVKESEILQKDIQRLDSERNAVMSNVAGQSVALYNQLRRQKRGMAVAAISDASCMACGATLNPMQQQSARSTTQFFNCPTCGRILYAN